MEEKIQIQKEEEQIQHEFDCLLEAYKKSKHRQKIEIITKAFHFANAAHKGIRRRSGEAYILHPIAVARIAVSEIGLGSTSICSALLHDVVEDTDYTVEDIENLFGKKIASIVDGLTKISGGVFAEKASGQAENFRKLLLTMSEDIRVILIKIADRLHNMRTLSSMPHAKQLKIIGETLYIYAPLAHRLGLFPIKTELEDLSFKYEHPSTYESINQKLAVGKEKQLEIYHQFSDPIHDKIQSLGYKFSLSARLKSVYSIWKKMSKRNISFEDVYDILAVRIVFEPKENLSEKDQCWIIYSAITELYKPHPERIRDWISMPKANGYEALHVTVMSPLGKWIEVQIRTTRMHDIAEKGLAAHWKYKAHVDNGSNESELDKWLKTLKEMLKDPEPNAIDFMDTFKLNLFSSEIFVFTPSGEIKTLPQGSTALDLAFQLHTDIGLKSIAAKVNHKLVPINHSLNSGDQIEILTSKIRNPQPEWVEFVTTARAQKAIEDFFKKERSDLRKKGEKELLELLKNNNLEFSIEIQNKLLKHFNFKKQNELLLRIGKGDIQLTEVLKAINKQTSENSWLRYLKMPFNSPFSNNNNTNEEKEKTTAENIKNEKNIILTEENAEKEYQLAPCCRPIPGDEIMGYVDNSIVMIHKKQCEVAMRLKSNFGKQIITAEWHTHKVFAFEQTFEVRGIDQPGIVVEVIRIVSEKYALNMKEINISSEAGIFFGKFIVFVHDTEEIKRLCNDIMKLKAVKSVQRIEQKTNNENIDKKMIELM